MIYDSNILETAKLRERELERGGIPSEVWRLEYRIPRPGAHDWERGQDMAWLLEYGQDNQPGLRNRLMGALGDALISLGQSLKSRHQPATR